jgi:hypothetical protein
MKKEKIVVICYVVFQFLYSCNTIEKKIQGDWAIEDIKAPFVLLTNGLNLKKDHSCELPMVNVSERHTNKEIGEWRIFEKNKKSYLQIISENEYFNDIYEISNINRVQDTVSFGFLIKMTLTSDKTTMRCARAEI